MANPDGGPQTSATAAASWHQLYTMLEAGQVPWNAGGPDPDLARLCDLGKIPAPAPDARALDLGTGLGHDAIYLAKRGFRVLAVDIAASAVSVAQPSANLAEVGDKIEFQREDALRLALPQASFALAYDRGLFHYFTPPQREHYAAMVHAALVPGGHFVLRTYSDKEAPGIGPTRFSRAQLEKELASRFEFLEVSESVFAGPSKPKSYFCLLRKLG